MSTLSTLFPLSEQQVLEPSARLGDHRLECNLCAVKLATTVCKRMLSDLNKRRLPAFDALVGDRACHIRAALLPGLCEDKAVHEEATKLTEMCARIEQTVSKLRGKPSPDDRDLPLFALSEKYMLDISLSESMRFLYLSYLLTCSAQPGNPRRTDPNRLQNFDRSALGRHREISKQAVERAQKALSELGIQLLRGRMVSLGKQGLVTALSFPHIKSVIGRKGHSEVAVTVACATQAVRAALELLREEQRVLCLEMAGKRLYFRRANEGETMEELETIEKPCVGAVLVADAEESSLENLRKEVLDIGVEAAVVGAAAAEPQFGPEQDPKRIAGLQLTEELEELQTKAAGARSMMSIRHMYADILLPR